MNCRMEQLPALPTVYMRRVGAYGAENYALMAALKAWANERGLLEDGVIYGIAHDDAHTPPEQCRYDVCLVAEADCPADAQVQRGEIQAGRYAVFTVAHTAQAVQAFWAGIAGLLLQENLQYDTARPLLERYQSKLVRDGLCEFCVPVRQTPSGGATQSEGR